MSEKTAAINQTNLIKKIVVFIALWYIYFISIPSLTPGGMTGSVVLGVLAFLLLTVKDHGKFSFNVISRLWLVAFFIILLSCLVSISVSTTIKAFISVFAFFVIEKYMGYDKNKPKDILKLIMFFEIIALIVSYIQLLIPGLYFSLIAPRIAGSASHNLMIFQRIGLTNGLFAQTGMNAFFLSIGLFYSYNRFLLASRAKIINLILALLFLIAILMTGKRSFFFISMLVIVYLSYIKYRNDKRASKLIRFAILVVFGFALISILPNIFPDLEYTFSRVSNFINDRDIGNRKQLYEEALRAIKQYPFGLGYNAFFSYSLTGAGAHNSYLQIMAELGWIGGIVFFIPSLFAIFYLLFHYKKYSYSFEEEENISICTSIAVQVMFMIYALSGNPFNTPCFLLLLFYFQDIGISECYSRRLSVD